MALHLTERIQDHDYGDCFKRFLSSYLSFFAIPTI